jgi:AcrR family transcriptional regulator
MGTRDRILDAASEVMRELGLARATTREIAAAASVSEATLYKHFLDKQDLFLAVLAERIPLLSAVIADLPDRVGLGTVRENLEAVTAAAIEFYAVVFPMGASLFAEPKLLNAFRDGLIERGTGPHKPLQALAAYLEAERERGRLAPDVDPPAVAALLLGACFHRALLIHFDAPPITATDRTAPEALVAALCTPLLAER